jgi:hypothetical protein
MEGCAFGVLQAVVGPKGLRAIGGFDGFVGLFGVGGGEGNVLGGVPVLGEDDVVELLRQGVDGGDYGIAVCYG